MYHSIIFYSIKFILLWVFFSWIQLCFLSCLHIWSSSLWFYDFLHGIKAIPEGCRFPKPARNQRINQVFKPPLQWSSVNMTTKSIDFHKITITRKVRSFLIGYCVHRGASLIFFTTFLHCLDFVFDPGGVRTLILVYIVTRFLKSLTTYYY